MLCQIGLSACLWRLCMLKPHLHAHFLHFKRRHSVKALFHGHKDASQDSGAGPQQLPFLTQIMERELPFDCGFDFDTEDKEELF